ncbi:MAG: hypothetical protein RLZZ04_4139 [Cyanobacteriota bacterium]|jgi:hypothetical protein
MKIFNLFRQQNYGFETKAISYKLLSQRSHGGSLNRTIEAFKAIA